MLTSVSSISTTIESNSERAAENFMGQGPHDMVGSPETRGEDFRRVLLFSYRHSIARQRVRSVQPQLLPEIFRLRQKRPQRSRETRVVYDRSRHRRVRKVEQLAIHLAARH